MVGESSSNARATDDARPAAYEPLWTQDDAQRYLQVGRTVLYQLMRQREDPLPYLLIAGRRRFDPEAVRSWALRQGGDEVASAPAIPANLSPEVAAALDRAKKRLKRA